MDYFSSLKRPAISIAWKHTRLNMLKSGQKKDFLIVELNTSVHHGITRAWSLLKEGMREFMDVKEKRDVIKEKR
jgi:hypothetical protein